MDRWFANSEALGPAQAAALPMALSTAYWHLARLGLDRGKGVLVRGTGTTVGSAAVQITLVYKVGGKIFALISMGGPARVNLKVDPELARSLVRDYPGITPGYHMNKQHWVTVHLDSPLPADMVESMVEDSYDLVVSGLSPKVRAGLARAARGPTRGGGDRPPSARP